jgi:hypothetical protein
LRPGIGIGNAKKSIYYEAALSILRGPKIVIGPRDSPPSGSRRCAGFADGASRTGEMFFEDHETA